MTDHFTLNSRAWVHVIVDVKTEVAVSTYRHHLCWFACMFLKRSLQSQLGRLFWTKLSKADLHLGLAT